MRNIPDIELANSVLISLGNGSTGSGFILRTEDYFYLVTAKHVLLNEENKIITNEIIVTSQGISIETGSASRISVDLTKAELLWNATDDVILTKIGRAYKDERGLINRYFKHIRRLEIGNSHRAATLLSKTLGIDEVLISNDVYLFGYPTSLGIQLNKHYDVSKPLLRKGIVAGINKKSNTIILDCPAYPGNSGGPVLQVTQLDGIKTFNIIGVVSKYIPYEQKWMNPRDKLVNTEYLNSGYSIITAMNPIYALINPLEYRTIRVK